jgi:hypothetical protein
MGTSVRRSETRLGWPPHPLAGSRRILARTLHRDSGQVEVPSYSGI